MSENGFTGPAKRHAEAKGAIAISPQDVAGDHPGRRLMDEIRSLDVQEVTFEIKHMVMTARRPNGKQVQVRVPFNMNVYSADGRYLTMLTPLFEAERAANAAEFHKDVPEDGGGLEANLHPRWNLPDGRVVDDIYAQWQETDPPELQLIEEIVVLANIAVEDSPTIEMISRQLGDVAYAYGETTLGGKRALVVLTANERADSSQSVRSETSVSSHTQQHGRVRDRRATQVRP